MVLRASLFAIDMGMLFLPGSFFSDYEPIQKQDKQATVESSSDSPCKAIALQGHCGIPLAYGIGGFYIIARANSSFSTACFI